MTENLLKLNLTEKTYLEIGEHYDGETPFYSMDMEDMNVKDAKTWLDEGELNAIVDDSKGIIGYVHKDYIDEIVAVLNKRKMEI